jgi:two-component system CheB/CheR fusion protein
MSAIQSDGGVTFAQDATAKYDAMPRSAIAAGAVDFILPPEAIAQKVADIAASGRVVTAADGASPDEERELLPVLSAVRKATGVDFAQYRRTTVLRRVRRRMMVRHLDDLRAYADLLAQDPSEAAALAEDVLIHVTSFFRDPAAFDALASQVFPRLLANRPAGAPIRVWVPGCSSGEEAYSIAIALTEFLAAEKADVPVKLFGTDVSEAALEKARAARYLENIAIDVSPVRLQEFFVPAEGGYQIRRSIRDMCVFARQDVTRDPPFSNMDLISCRNLLIYLGPALQSRVLPIFHYALNERGFLLLGGSEGVHAQAGFAVVDPKHKIFARSPLAMPRLLDFADRGRMFGAPTVARPGPQMATQLEIQKEAERAVLGEYAPPGVVVTDDLVIVQFRGDTGAYLRPAAGAATFDLLRMVRDDLRVELRQAMDEARKSGKPTRRRVVLGRGPIELGVLPFTATTVQQPLYAIVFDELPASVPAAAAPEEGDVERQLRSEIAQTREYLQSVIEQLEAGTEELKAANEETVSSNEELQSTNEELETAKEELQAANEELATINQEMMDRNREAMRLNDDLANVLTSASVPIVILGRDGRIRRFTPAASKVLHFIGADVGRPLVDIKSTFEGVDLVALVAEVLEHLAPVERSVTDASGRWYSLVVRPYMTVDNRVDGAVIVLHDVDMLTKKGEQAVISARDVSESTLRDMLSGAAEPILMIDAEGHIVFANPAAHRTYGYAPGELLGAPLDLLVPERLRSKHAAHRAAFGADMTARAMGRGGMDLYGRRKDGSEFPVEVALAPMKGAGGSLVMAFATDISERKAAERRLLEYQERLRHLAFDAALIEERERRRIAINLHDGVGQSLALAQNKLATARTSLDGPLRATIEECVRLIDESITQTRSLTFDLSPPILYDLGLEPALQWLGEEMEKRYGMRVEVEGDKDLALAPEAAAMAFRAVRELLTNVFKHAGTPAAKVTLRKTGESVAIRVQDEGVGYDASEHESPGSGVGFGLFSIREQIERLGGSVEIQSTPREGTSVSLVVPASRRPSVPPPTEQSP